MIHYQLRCQAGHEFDGWFKDAASFEQQAEARFIECPSCGDRQIERALMAPSLGRNRTEPAPANPGPAAALPASPTTSPAGVAAGGAMPDHLRAMLQKLRSEVEKNCDYVGGAFADEARKIHRGDSERRGIYGETTPDQAKALADEGVEVSSIPWVRRAES